MLYKYLEAECAKKLAERKKAVEALKTPEDVARRQADLRAKFLAALGGLPERTPLNPRVTGTLRGEGFTVEKVIFESRPDHHVTANLYLPEGKGPVPGVIFPLGHYSNPKPADEYQRACIMLAKNGLAAMSYDPIGQGERHQTLDEKGKPRAHGTSEHTLVDVGALLVGTCAAQQFIWDGIRALDYLQSRPEIDPKRLGCMGNSGGGTLTAYLMAVDERVGCAIPNCFITSQEKLFATVGPQDGEANIPGQVSWGMGHPDYFLLRAPKPAQLSAPTRDYYDIQGAWDTFREAKKVYGILGYAERMDLFEYDEPHSIARPFREAGTRWMRRWLLGKDDAPVETDFPVFKEAELQCTQSGHVLKDFKEKTSYAFTADRERALAAKRVKLGRAELLAEVRRRIAVGEVGKATRRGEGAFETDPGILIPAVQARPERPEGARVLLAHGEGKAKAEIEALVRAGREVVAIDLRGMGETEPLPPHKGLVNFVKADWKEAYLAFNLNRPLLGQRVRDLLMVAAAIDEDGRGVHLIGVGAAAPAALHAAALDPRFREVTLDGMVLSWSLVARTPITIHQLTNVVPGALEAYDLPELAASLAPRPLTVRASTDPVGKPLPQADLDAAYAPAHAAYEAQGAEAAFTLRAK